MASSRVSTRTSRIISSLQNAGVRAGLNVGAPLARYVAKTYLANTAPGVYLSQQAKSAVEYMMDSATKLNPHLPHLPGDQVINAQHAEYGVADVSIRCAAHLKQLDEKEIKHPGVVITSVANKPYIYVRDPRLIEEVLDTNYSNLQQEEAGKVQAVLFHEETLINTSIHDPSYPAKRQAVLHALYTPLTQKGDKDTLSNLVQTILNKYLEILKEYADAGKEVDLNHFMARIAMTVIADVILGFKKFSEAKKIKITDLVHKIVIMAVNPLNLAYLNTGVVPPAIKPLMDEAIALLKGIIRDNKETAQPKLSEVASRMKSENAEKPIDLENDDAILGLIKLFLTGGFETTSKTLFWSMVMLSDPKIKEFVAKMREEIAAISNPEKLLSHDFEEKDANGEYKFKYTRAFVLEMFRFMPTFAEQRHGVKNAFTLSGNIHIPKDTIIITSAYHGHRNDKKTFGEDATEFNPERWVSKKYSLKDTTPNPALKTFGADGKRRCPGRLLAQFEAWKFLIGVVKNFDVIPKDEKNPIPVHHAGFTLEVAEGPSTTVRLQAVKRKTEKLESKESKEDGYRTEEEQYMRRGLRA